jgi:DeoR/GlpR family transcriptional regulator of sugar metabolism
MLGNTLMFAIERIRIIKNYLIENKQVEVNQLSQMLGVSEVTIRRDLEKLESDEFLTRTHGGAVLGSAKELTSDNIDASLLKDYNEISKIAIRMINDGDVIMLTNGEINYFEILKSIKQTGYNGYIGLEYFPIEDAVEGLQKLMAKIEGS